MATLSATPQLPPGQSPSANNYPRIQIFPCRGTLHRAPLSFPSRNSRFPSPIPISERCASPPNSPRANCDSSEPNLVAPSWLRPLTFSMPVAWPLCRIPGAVLCLWQPNKNTGTGISASHGTLCCADLNTPDQARAGQFYSDLFGWQMMMKEDEDLAHNYWHIKNGEEF